MSAHPILGNALEFTGPAANSATRKFVDFGANVPELINVRPPAVDQATTVEYWIKTAQSGTTANQTWTSPSLLANESPGDGDMYWGWLNATMQFGFSTSDLVEVFADGVTDDQWHHIVMVKIWNRTEPCISRLYVDGGTANGGQTIETTTAAGTTSYQDSDGGIRFLGFTQNGGGGDVQFIGQVDEVAIYNKAFSEAQARRHFIAGGGARNVSEFNPIIRNPNGTITISWEGPGILQQATTLTGPGGNWMDVNPQPMGNSITIMPTGNTLFYRLEGL